jgi:hypothetical protein
LKLLQQIGKIGKSLRDDQKKLAGEYSTIASSHNSITKPQDEICSKLKGIGKNFLLFSNETREHWIAKADTKKKSMASIHVFPEFKSPLQWAQQIIQLDRKWMMIHKIRQS